MIRTDTGGERTVFLIDFGLAQQFHNPATYLRIPYSTDHLIIGTLPFTSIDGQQGHAQSRHDDLESLAYTILFLAHGDLPWSGLCDQEAVLQKKLSNTLEELCAGLPAPFHKFIDHICSLQGASKRSRTTNIFISSSCNVHQVTLICLAKHPLSLLLPPPLPIVRCKHTPCSLNNANFNHILS